MKSLLPMLLLLLATLPASAQPRGTGDLGVVVERASGQLLIVEIAAAAQFGRRG